MRQTQLAGIILAALVAGCASAPGPIASSASTSEAEAASPAGSQQAESAAGWYRSGARTAREHGYTKTKESS